MTRLVPFRPRGDNWPCSCISMTFSLASGGAGGPTAAQGGEPCGDRASGGAAAERGRARRARGQGTAFRKAARSRPGPRVIGMGTGVLRRTVARGEPDTTMATTAKRGRLRATAASYVLVRDVLKTSTQRLPRDMRVHYAPGCSRRGLAWHRP